MNTKEIPIEKFNVKFYVDNQIYVEKEILGIDPETYQ